MGPGQMPGLAHTLLGWSIGCFEPACFREWYCLGSFHAAALMGKQLGCCWRSGFTVFSIRVLTAFEEGGNFDIFAPPGNRPMSSAEFAGFPSLDDSDAGTGY